MIRIRLASVHYINKSSFQYCRIKIVNPERLVGQFPH